MKRIEWRRAEIGVARRLISEKINRASCSAIASIKRVAMWRRPEETKRGLLPISRENGIVSNARVIAPSRGSIGINSGSNDIRLVSCDPHHSS